jgi:hypothetical protein
LSKEEKQKIDKMSQLEMARLWRFAPSTEPLFQGDTGKYFKKVFKEKGFFSPKISKTLEWEE